MERPENSNDDLTGITLAERFLITGKLGQGGMGSIYTAHDAILNRDVAIKTIARTNLNNQELVRFQREARAASTLKHPNVIQMLDFGVSESGQPYMVMELIQGISLAQLLDEKGALSAHFALQIIEQVADGMAGVHKSGIVHRDLKTSNIMLLLAGMQTNQPLIKILDFGIAKSLGPDEQVKTLTKAGEIFGSPNSMSPEQARGEDLDHRSDIYSLGCIAFELLTGRPIFEGDSVMAVLAKHISEPAPRLWEVANTAFPMEVERLVAHMVLKDPNERYQSMQDVIKNLREVYSAIAVDDFDAAFKIRDESDVEEVGVPAQSRKLSATMLLCAASVASLLAASIWYIAVTLKAQTPSASKADRSLKQLSERLDMVDDIHTNADLENYAFNHSGRVTPRLEKLVKEKKIAQEMVLFDSEIVPGDATLMAKLEPQVINLSGCTGVTNKFLKGISEITSIQFLNFDRVKGLIPADLVPLSKLPRLTMVKAVGCDLTDEHLKALGRCKNLRVVQIGNNKQITPKGIEYLGGQRGFVEVMVNQPAITLLADFERKRLKSKYKILLVKQQDFPEDISPKSIGKLGGLAMDEIFGPIGGSGAPKETGSGDHALDLLPPD